MHFGVVLNGRGEEYKYKEILLLYAFWQRLYVFVLSTWVGVLSNYRALVGLLALPTKARILCLDSL
jgi:hypothetical protein